MSYSLPIVATDVGAVRDAVVEGKGGWLCDAQSEKSLMTAVTKALVSRLRWEEMGSYNRKLYEQNFGIEGFVESWRALLFEQMNSDDCIA